MNDFSKRFLIGLGVLLATVLLAVVGYMLKFGSETDMMKPLNTGTAAPGIAVVRDSYVNMYLIRDGEGWVAVDACMNAKTVARELKTLKIEPESVKAVLLTHSDADHTGAVSLFSRAKVYLSEAEVPLITGKKSRFFVVGNRLSVPYTTLQDGQRLQLDDLSVQCILLPGHTPGSMVYCVNGRYLFTGDSISLWNGQAEPFNGFFNMNTRQQVENIPRLNGMNGIEGIFTAHYGMTDDYTKAFQTWQTRKALPPISD